MDSSSTTTSTKTKRPSWWLRLVDAFWTQAVGPVLSGFETFGQTLMLLVQKHNDLK